MILNGVVAVGHNDDTDTDSDAWQETSSVAYLAGGANLLSHPPWLSCWIWQTHVHTQFVGLEHSTNSLAVFIVGLAGLHQTWPTRGRRRCTEKGCGISESTISYGAIQSASQTVLKRFQRSILGELSQTALEWFIQMRFCMQPCQV